MRARRLVDEVEKSSEALHRCEIVNVCCEPLPSLVHQVSTSFVAAANDQLDQLASIFQKVRSRAQRSSHAA